MLIEERRRRLLDTVNARGSLTVAEAEKQLRVSRMTVHRDLDVLASQGLVRKVHGGVVALTQRGTDLFDPRAQPFEERLAVGREAKRAIAKHVAKLISGANTLLFDASTTVYFLSEHLGRTPESRERYIVTGSLPLFTELIRRHEGVRVALHGGEPHIRTGSLVGPLAIGSLQGMRFDYAVLSCLGVLEEEGDVFVASSDEVLVKQAYLACSRQTILACDTSKFGHSGAHRLGATEAFDYVVTEKAVYTKEAFKAAVKKGTLKKRRSGGG